MKIKYIIFLYFASSCNLDASRNQEEFTGSGGLTIIVNNGSESNGTQHAYQNADHLSSQSTGVRTSAINGTEPNLSKKLYDFYEHQLKNAQDMSNGITGWIGNNKLATTGIGLLCGYSYIFYQIYRANLIINNPNSWSNWHNGRTLEDLFATPQSSLESDLLFAIQTRYVHPANPTDFIYSLVQSSNSLNFEMSILQNQISRYKWLETCCCMPLFFINTQEFAILQERHRKLSFIKHLFASWCAAYKIERNS